MRTATPRRGSAGFLLLALCAWIGFSAGAFAQPLRMLVAASSAAHATAPAAHARTGCGSMPGAGSEAAHHGQPPMPADPGAECCTHAGCGCASLPAAPGATAAGAMAWSGPAGPAARFVPARVLRARPALVLRPPIG